MQIVRTEIPTGTANRTRREEILPLNTGGREVEPEVYLDESESTGWPWESDPNICTWDIQLETLRQFTAPFEVLDSQAATEQADGDDDKGGVYTYPFSNRFQPIGDGNDDGDLNSANWQEKINAHTARYFNHGKPQGGTEIMAAINAGDMHFLGNVKHPGEFFDKPRDERPVRARVVFTDGLLHDAALFRAYLANATHSPDGYGSHGEWDEVWAVAVFGEGANSQGNPGKEAYEQYEQLAKDHPWIHVYYFERVTNPSEIAEDMALAVVPVNT